LIPNYGKRHRSKATVRERFTGYERDNESNLDYAINRYYNGSHGRFSSVDPYNIIFEIEKGRDEKEKLQIFIAYISQPQIWNKYVYAGNNPLSFTDPDGRQPKTINVFVGGNNEDGMADWKKFKAEAKKQGITVHIYRVEDGTATAAKLIESLKAKDTVTIFSGHSQYTTHNGQKEYHYALQLNGSTVGSSAEGLSTDTADGVDIKNDIVAVFSCDFGKAFDRVTSSNGAVFVSIQQGEKPGSGIDSVNSAALSFAKSIGQRNGGVLTSTDDLSKAIARAQAGFNSFSSPDNAGDRVVSRKLFPAGRRR